MLRIGLAAIPLCVVATSNSLAQGATRSHRCHLCRTADTSGSKVGDPATGQFQVAESIAHVRHPHMKTLVRRLNQGRRRTRTPKAKQGWCQLGQMPQLGPFISDPGYSVKLSNGTVISGADIDANIVWWLTNNIPEK